MERVVLINLKAVCVDSPGCKVIFLLEILDLWDLYHWDLLQEAFVLAELCIPKE